MPPNILLQFMHMLERPQALEDAQREVLRNGYKNVWAAVYRLYVYVIHAYILVLYLRESITHMLITQKIICIYFAHQRFILKHV